MNVYEIEYQVLVDGNIILKHLIKLSNCTNYKEAIRKLKGSISNVVKEPFQLIVLNTSSHKVKSMTPVEEFIDWKYKSKIV